VEGPWPLLLYLLYLLHLLHSGVLQKFYVAIFCLLIIPSTYQTLIMSFIGNSPPWMCVIGENNGTGECQIEGVIDKQSSYYTERCKLPRQEWQYTKPFTFSIVTEVKFILDLPAIEDIVHTCIV